MDLNGYRVAFIGGAGFIGHNLALSLTKCGAEVFISDSLQVNNLFSFISNNNSTADNELPLKILHDRLNILKDHKIPLMVEDARNYHTLSKFIDSVKPNVVIQLAAVAHADRSNKDPYSTFDHSLRTLENALDCCKNRDVHFIYFSSSMVYGNFKNESVVEEDLCEPLGIYGALKFAGEKMVIAYHNVFGLPYTIVRPSALYGERCVSRRVVQCFIENAITGKKVQVSGDGSERLDFTYIKDLIAGIQLVIKNKNSRSQIFNLTHGASKSIAELAEIVQESFPDLEIEYTAKDRLNPKRGTLNVDKARNLIGYKPAYNLERGAKLYIDWYRKIVEQKSDTSVLEVNKEFSLVN